MGGTRASEGRVTVILRPSAASVTFAQVRRYSILSSSPGLPNFTTRMIFQQSPQGKNKRGRGRTDASRRGMLISSKRAAVSKLLMFKAVQSDMQRAVRSRGCAEQASQLGRGPQLWPLKRRLRTLMQGTNAAVTARFKIKEPSVSSSLRRPPRLSRARRVERGSWLARSAWVEC